MGDLKKTNKATLLNEVEKLTEPLDSLPDAYASIFDGMAIVQKARTTELTFGELAVSTPDVSINSVIKQRYQTN